MRYLETRLTLRNGGCLLWHPFYFIHLSHIGGVSYYLHKHATTRPER